jgi:shikimate kinase
MVRDFANIALVGMMGVGKSTVARLVAAELRWTALDTDEAVVARAGMTIADIFATCGEEAFRQMEHEILAALVSGEKAVVATGGGAVLREDNRLALLRRCFVVWLQASPAESCLRAASGERRPLLESPNPEETVSRLLELRAPFYAIADAAVMTDGRSPEEVADEVVSLWRSRS